MLAPAANLAVEVIARFAVAFKTLGLVIHRMQSGDDAVHFQVNVASLSGGHAGQGLVPQNTALHELHDVKRATNDGFVFAQDMHLRHWHTSAVQTVHHLELAFNGMGRGQQLGHRSGLGPHHIAGVGRVEFVGGVGLAALEHLHLQGAFKARHVLAQPVLQGGCVEAVRVTHLFGANEIVKVAHGLTPWH